MRRKAIAFRSFRKLGAPLAGFSVIEAADIDEVIPLVANTPGAVRKEQSTYLSSIDQRPAMCGPFIGAFVATYEEMPLS
jgi:hypothetical protein